MNELATTKSEAFVWRRNEMPFNFFGMELPSEIWVVLLTLILMAAFFYTGWMYLKDSKGVGPLWATFLGLLRASVYGVLAAVFMLPSLQSWEETTDRSKVLILFDPTASMTETRDDPPEEGKPFNLMPTRMDKVLAFLEKNDSAFLAKLVEKNPVTAYRIAANVDDNFFQFDDDGRVWTREEREAHQREADPTKKDELLPDRGLLPTEFWHAWLKPAQKPEFGAKGGEGQGLPLTWNARQKERFTKMLATNARMVEGNFFNSSNITDSVLATVNKEINKMVQGIIVFTDGRNTTSGSAQTLLLLEQRARDARIPLFVIGVGTERQLVRVDLVDIRAPKVVRPEDSFKAVVEVTGEGLPDQPARVELEVTRVNRAKNGKEELLDLVLVEAETKGSKDRKKEEISLGKKLLLQPAEPVSFDRSSPPRAEVEFQIDAISLAKAAGIDLTSEKYRGKKWELGETKGGDDKEGDELRLIARIPRDKAEIFPDPIHVSEKVGLKVVRKPLQVLLFASGATRDYQFVRTLMFREMEKERVLLSIYLQNPPGVTERRQGINQDVPAKRLLDAFPDKFDEAGDDEDARLKDLSSYDVLIAFDPDWTQLSEKELLNVQKWVDRGGGLIAVGGPINTLQLARPGANKDKLKPVLELYPVVLKDIRIEELDRQPDRPWPLTFEGATPDMEFLKLSDETDRGAKPFLSDWVEFWGRNKDNPDRTAVERGFFNYYPVEAAKTGSIVVARFTDPAAKLKDGSQEPYIVVSAEGSGRRVVWLGSGEMWRLRMFKETFHERFWTKLARFAGSANQGKSNKRITPYIGHKHLVNKFIDVEFKIDGKGGQPLARNSRPPKLVLKLPAGVNPKEMPTEYDLKPKTGGDGLFATKFQVRSPGSYGLELQVPETKDTWSGKINVDPSNPELDNTRPDFALMYQMASEAGPVLARITDPTVKNELRKRLTRPTLADVKPADKPDAKDGAKAEKEAAREDEDKLRLYFDLKNAELIPSCMIADTSSQKSRGPIKDYWDDGFTIWDRDPPEKPIKLSYVLLAVVGLLSIEWLTRKLLRLA